MTPVERAILNITGQGVLQILANQALMLAALTRVAPSLAPDIKKSIQSNQEFADKVREKLDAL